MNRRLVEEIQNFLLLCFFTFLALLQWRLFFGWKPGTLISAYDAWIHHYLTLSNLYGGNASLQVYDPAWLGGAPNIGVSGRILAEIILHKLGFSYSTMLNGAVLFSLGTCAYFGQQLLRHFGIARYISIFLAFFIFIGNPSITIRITHGHINFLFGIQALLALALLMAWVFSKNLRFHYLHIFLIFFSWAQAFGYITHQVLIYGLVFFFFPLWAYGLWATPLKKSFIFKSFTSFLILSGATLLALPDFLEFFFHARSNDASRTFENILFAYAPLEWGDLLKWLSANYLTEKTKDWFLYHEKNYPFSVSILAPLLLFRFEWISKKTALFILASLALQVLFVMDLITPFILSLASPLSWFRVPQRSFIFTSILFHFLFVLWAFGSQKGAALLSGLRPRLFSLLTMLALILAIKWLTELRFVFEISIWILALTCFWLGPYRKNSAFLQLTTGLAFCALLNVASADRSGAFPNPALLENKSLPIQEGRATLNFSQFELKMNFPKAFGIWSIQGTAAPFRRFNLVVSNFEKVDPSSDRLYYPLISSHPGFAYFRQLYSINFLANGPAGLNQFEALGEKLPMAWFPKFATRVSSETIALEKMRELRPEELRANALIEYSGPLANCPKSDIEIRPPESEGIILVSTKTDSPDCLLAVSLNFSERLRAVARANGEKLKIFPLNVATIGILVPEGKSEILLTAERYSSESVKVGSFLFSFILLVVALILANNRIQDA